MHVNDSLVARWMNVRLRESMRYSLRYGNLMGHGGAVLMAKEWDE